jgi:hypothetical protein
MDVSVVIKEGLSQYFPTTAAWKGLKRKYPGDASPEHGMTHTKFYIYKGGDGSASCLVPDRCVTCNDHRRQIPRDHPKVEHKASISVV